MDNTTAIAYGWNSVPRTDPPDQRLMAMVQEHYPSGNTSSWCSECDSVRRIKSGEGQNKLETLPSSFWPDQPTIRTATGGPICFQVDTPTPQLRELVPGTIACDPGPVTIQRSICKPPMEHDKQSPIPGLQTACSVSPDCPSVEVTTLVPLLLEMVVEIPALLPNKRNLIANTPCQSTRHKPTTSRVGHLWEKFRGQKLSEKASRLLLSSWRPKSSKTYESLFTKLASWCSERGSDPISGDIGEVVNFLAHLFHQGYQYRSLNSYRSCDLFCS